MGLFRRWIPNGYSESAVFSLYRQDREFKINQALAQSSQALVAIKIDSMLSYTTEAGISPRRATHFLSPESKQRAQPDCLRPRASLRANLRHAIQAAVRQNSLCATRAAQTGCRKFVHDALALCGANARSPNRVPQALTHGWERIRAACESYEQTGLQRLFSKRKQLSKVKRSYPASGIAPFAHACDGGLLVLAAAP